MLRPNAQPRALSYAKNRMQKGRIPSISAAGNMDPLGYVNATTLWFNGHTIWCNGNASLWLANPPGMMPATYPWRPWADPPV